MNFCINDMLYSFSYALDCVEHDLIGVATHHGQRVACMCVAMGRQRGMSEETLLDLAAAAVMHDNALTEYIRAEWQRGVDIVAQTDRIALGEHCTMGEKNLLAMPFLSDMTGAILYHHENADRTGPFEKHADETPLCAQLIHIADTIDATWDLSFVSDAKYEALQDYLSEQTDKQFSRQCVDLFRFACSKVMLQRLHREKATVVLQEYLPDQFRDFSSDEIVGIANVIANIIDYKSKFTRTHSLGIAQKASIMARFYACPEEEVTKLYFAGAVHDIGKLVVDRDILEKPDKLTDKEYAHIQNHAYYSYDMLRRIKGLEDVTQWASLHHEKLNGKGYPFGKNGDALNRNERLMACLDIYQALTEDRPYKQGMPHAQAIDILRDMGQKGLLDNSIIADIDSVFAA